MENFEDAKLQEPFLAKIQATKSLLDGLKNTCQDLKNYEQELGIKIFDSEIIENVKNTSLDVIQQENSLKDLIACISSSIGEMEDLFKNFVVDEDNDKFCPNYKFKLNETLKEMANSNEDYKPENDFRYIHLDEILIDNSNEFTEISNSQLDRIPIDPFTQMEIKNPVRNKKCNHIYDKEGIFAYINQAQAKHKSAKCPTIGCTRSKTLCYNDIIEDNALKERIELLRHNSNK